MIWPSRVALDSMAHGFIEVHKPPHRDKALTHEGSDFVDPALQHILIPNYIAELMTSVTIVTITSLLARRTYNM